MSKQVDQIPKFNWYFLPFNRSMYNINEMLKDTEFDFLTPNSTITATTGFKRFPKIVPHRLSIQSHVS